MEVFIVRHGGVTTEEAGGGGLNFEVVGGTTQPENPSENMIWINTDTEISGYTCSETEPTEPVEGMVWVCLNETVNTPINVCEENPVMLYISNCMQYESGAFVFKDAAIYQSEAWNVLWYGKLYSPGNEWENVTGGWKATAKKSDSDSGVSAKAPTITRNDDGTIKAALSSGGGIFHTTNMIDLTDYKTLIFEGTFTRGGSVDYNLLAGVWKSFGSYYNDSAAASTALSGTSATSRSVNISSLTGKYYVGIGLTNSTAVITNCYLVK